LLGSEGARTAGGRCARPSPAWARRRRHGDGAGDLACAGVRWRERDDVRGGVHARQATTAGAQGWGRDGVSWRRPRRSPARRHGWRRARHPWLVGANETGCTAVCAGDREHGVPFSWRPCTRPTRPRRRGRPRHGGERWRRHEKGPMARPCLQGYGTRVLGCTLARERRGPHGRACGHARDADATWARRHGAAATKRGGILWLEG
jgi:hypothetical protein